MVLIEHFRSHSHRTISGQLLSRWISLRHSQDEAVEGLRQLPRVSFPIFGQNFAVAPLTLASVIAFPATIVTLLVSPYRRRSLPQDLAIEISKVADAAAASSLSKLRGSLNRLAFADDKRTRSDLISEYLTRDELIHTAYFKVPLFNKLIAYSIGRSEGFGQVRHFLRIPTTSGWLRGMGNSSLASVPKPMMALPKRTCA
jgi:hypothetical protein